MKLGYWNCRGIANPIRLALVCANVDFEEKSYDLVDGRHVWFEEDKKTLDLPMPDIPYLIDGD